MTLAIIIGALVSIFAIWIFLVVAKRTLRLAVRLLLVGVVILAAACGALAWWWYGSFGNIIKQKDARPSTIQRTNNR